MDDLNDDSNPLLDDEDDVVNPLLDDSDEEEEYEDSFDLMSLDVDVSNLSTGTFEHSRDLIEGNPNEDLIGYEIEDDALPGVEDVYVVKDEGHGEYEESAHSIPDFYVDVNGNEDDYDSHYRSRSYDSVDEEFDEGYENSDYDSHTDLDIDEDDSIEDTAQFDSFENVLNTIDEHDSDDPVSDDVDSILDAAFNGDESEDSFSGAYDLSEDDFEDEFSGFDIDAIIGFGIDLKASDIHISPNDYIAYTVLGDIRRVSDFGIIPATIVQRIFTNITSHVAQSDFATDLELDASYVVKKGKYQGRRLRLSVLKANGGDFAMVFRIISNIIPMPEDLGVEQDLIDWCDLPNGLVMMNGPTGTGKSSTLASLIHKIQMDRACKIITVERPVEFMYGTEGKALITQREVGRDTRTFAGALTSAMRQAPDIIMIGEVRNQTEVNELLRAAETGHLAISTMHTNSAPATVNRIRSLYQGDDQIRILGSLSENVRGFANQVLLQSKDGESRFAVREILNVDEEVSRMILHADIEGIKQYQIDREITMEHALVRAVSEDRCEVDAARRQATSIIRFNELLKKLG